MLVAAEQVAGAGSEGVVVVDIDRNGLAFEHGFKTGDVIAWNLQAWLADPKTPAQLVIRPGEREAIEWAEAIPLETAAELKAFG